MSEYAEHRDLIKRARANTDKHPELAWLITIPTEIGGMRSRFRPLLAKGAPDLVLPVRRMGFGGLWMELKYGKNRPTKEQKECLSFLGEQRYLSAWAVGCDAAWQLTLKYLNSEEISISEKGQYIFAEEGLT